MKQNLSKITSWPGRQLDALGMYRVVTLSLVFLVTISLIFGVLGVVVYSLQEQLLSLVTVLVVSLGSNAILARVLHVKPNHESALITALILFFLFTPGYVLSDHYYIAAAAAAAMASKYVLAYRKQHIFNAAAIGAVALSLSGWHEAWWWIGTPELFIPLLIVGVAVVHKVRRWPMVLSFLVAALLVEIREADVVDVKLFKDLVLSSPILFLGFFMLTEPFTAPPRKYLRICYGAFVGALASTTLFVDYVAVTPELALVVGNLLFWPATLQQKLYLKLKERNEVAADTHEFVFEKPAGMKFLPGQYLEWMVPHKSADTRGIRRYFTIASAPEESDVRLALRVVPEKGSSYKRELMDLETGEHITASQLAGDFVLPTDASQKCAFVAGGIGVTPFRSFVGHFLKTGVQRDDVLFYANNFVRDIAYPDLFKQAESAAGLKLVPVIAKEEVAGYEHGYLTKEIIERHAPDYLERHWYLSGPPGMVNAYEKLLRSMGVSRRNIKTDFFPGLA